MDRDFKNKKYARLTRNSSNPTKPSCHQAIPIFRVVTPDQKLHAISELIDVFEVQKNRRSVDLKSLKLQKGQSGCKRITASSKLYMP